MHLKINVYPHIKLNGARPAFPFEDFEEQLRTGDDAPCSRCANLAKTCTVVPGRLIHGNCLKQNDKESGEIRAAGHDWKNTACDRGDWEGEESNRGAKEAKSLNKLIRADI
ncbi:hypothetical protein AB1N83_009146 [Pleurotus pulmonarius]